MIFSVFLIIISCEDDKDPFLIKKNSIGNLNKQVQVNELDAVFPNDSIIQHPLSQQYMNEGTDIEIYEKNGKLLLLLQPMEEFDSTSTIGNIQIMDPRFQTEKGLNIESTFGDILENYSISRIENTLSSAVIFLDEINAYITIDKKHLPAEVRYNTDADIEASQIPNDAKFKHFMIGWN